MSSDDPMRLSLPDGTVLQVIPQRAAHTNAQRRRARREATRVRGNPPRPSPGVDRATRRRAGIR